MEGNLFRERKAILYAGRFGKLVTGTSLRYLNTGNIQENSSTGAVVSMKMAQSPHQY
jgi:hypothetical protein